MTSKICDTILHKLTALWVLKHSPGLFIITVPADHRHCRQITPLSNTCYHQQPQHAWDRPCPGRAVRQPDWGQGERRLHSKTGVKLTLFSTPLWNNSSTHDTFIGTSLQWHHNERDHVSNNRRLDCLLNCLYRCRSKKTSKLLVTGLCEGNSPWPVNSSRKGPVTRKMFPFDDVIIFCVDRWLREGWISVVASLLIEAEWCLYVSVN